MLGQETEPCVGEQQDTAEHQVLAHGWVSTEPVSKETRAVQSKTSSSNLAGRSSRLLPGRWLHTKQLAQGRLRGWSCSGAVGWRAGPDPASQAELHRKPGCLPLETLCFGNYFQGSHYLCPVRKLVLAGPYLVSGLCS